MTNQTQPENNNHNENRYRYSDKELQEFKELILNKLENARTELKYLQTSIQDTQKGNDENYTLNKIMEEGASTFEREQMSQLADRQRKFIKNLEDALGRIETKTYGVCQKTGKLISKERLRAVPHTTMSIEAKLNDNR
jgi:DnaK suppressor protein